MLITERAATCCLFEVGLSRRHALRVLHAGFAGAPMPTRSRTFYDADAVDALVTRPSVSKEAIAAAEVTGMAVARRDVDVRAPYVDQLAAVAGGWDIGLPTLLWCVNKIRVHSRLPFVVTVAGFVALGADIVDVTSEGRLTRWVLDDAGSWFDDFRERRFVTGPGRPTLFVGWSRGIT